MSSLRYNIKMIVGNTCINITRHVYQYSKKGIFGQFLFSMYIFIFKKMNLSIFPIECYVSYNNKVTESQLTTIERNRIGVSSKIVSVHSVANIKFYEYSLPDLLMLKCSNVNICGNSDIIVDTNNNCVISDVSYNVNSNIQIVDGLLYRTRNNVCVLRNNMCKEKKNIDSGIMVSGKFCNNYYHVLLENFIKLLYIKRLEIPVEVPILVDGKTMSVPSLKRIFELLAAELKRNIIEIKCKEIYHINTLYSINNVNKIPSHLITNSSDYNTYLYSQTALVELRNTLLTNCSNKEFPKRVFISRASTKRRNFNEDEVYEVLQKFGFEKIAPELLTIEEQMTLFHNAEYIVAGSGAALTNLIFVREKCNVICFGISSKGDEIPVFNTIANINGANFLYFPRKTKENGDVHSNYEIDCTQLECFLHQRIIDEHIK